METLQEYDFFPFGTVKQYEEIAKIGFPDTTEIGRSTLVLDMKARKGVFWSKRKQSLIPGKLKHGGTELDFKTFTKRLKNTLTN